MGWHRTRNSRRRPTSGRLRWRFSIRMTLVVHFLFFRLRERTICLEPLKSDCRTEVIPPHLDSASAIISRVAIFNSVRSDDRGPLAFACTLPEPREYPGRMITSVRTLATKPTLTLYSPGVIIEFVAIGGSPELWMLRKTQSNGCGCFANLLEAGCLVHHFSKYLRRVPSSALLPGQEKPPR